MDSQSAATCAREWVEATSQLQPDAQECFSVVHAELIGLIPGAATVGVANTHFGVHIFALDDLSLISNIDVTQTRHPDGVTWQLTWTLGSLLPGRRGVVLKEEIRANGGSTMRHRIWDLAPSDTGSRIVITGTEVVRGGVAGRPDRNEMTARMLASACGWRLPVPDESLSAYR